MMSVIKQILKSQTMAMDPEEVQIMLSLVMHLI